VSNNNILIFYSDSTDARTRKRIQQLINAGRCVTGIGFSRIRYNSFVKPFWKDYQIGTSKDGKYFARFGRFLLQYFRLLSFLSKRLKSHRLNAVYVINLDMLLMYLLVSVMFKCSPKIYYEVADIHPLLTKNSFLSRVLRKIEKFLVEFTVFKIVTTSIGFQSEYFNKLNVIDKEIFILENKVLFDRHYKKVDSAESLCSDSVCLGLFGAFRCDVTLKLIHNFLINNCSSTARLFGKPVNVSADIFQSLIDLPNCNYLGEYEYPHDLSHIYHSVNIVIGTDFSDSIANSRWLMPNRYYEAGYFKKLLVVSDDTQLAKLVLHNKIGVVTSDDDVSFSKAIWVGVDMISSCQIAKTYASLSESLFRDHDDIKMLFDE
jgi:succinoglycan biosynthesis protein ExoL